MSKTEDDEEFSIRDKMAIAIFQGLLEHSISDISDFIGYFDTKDPDKQEAKKHFSSKMERKIRASYKLADMMRKIRLSSFE